MTRLMVLLPVLFALGCQSVEKRTYDITVRNASPVAVTLWITKDGEPYNENGWVSPEDLAVNSPNNQDFILAGVVVPAGKTAYTGPRIGHFARDTQAILRVYDGQLKFNEILAVGRGSPLRIDLPVPVGISNWILTRDSEGIIEIHPENATPKP